MNEWQERAKQQADEFAAELTEIAGELGDWYLEPWDGEGYPPHWRRLCERDTHRVILAGGYNAAGKPRIEFKPCGWPEYTDEHGSKQTKTPSNLWNPKEVLPVCTAARGRDPKAVARQIGKLMPDYDRIYSRLQEIAKQAQTYHNDTKGAKERLALATGNQFDTERRNGTFYLRRLQGDPVRIEFRSIGDCQLNLSTDETLAVIDLLYKRRNGKGLHADYMACPECGCTDVEVSAWIHDNTGDVISSGNEGPTDQAYCPQCELNGYEGHIGKTAYLVATHERQPVRK